MGAAATDARLLIAADADRRAPSSPPARRSWPRPSPAMSITLRRAMAWRRRISSPAPRAAAPHIAAADASVGARILGAMEATWARGRPEHQSRHRAALRAAGSCRADARRARDLRRETAPRAGRARPRRRRPAFRAIALANPAGLGSAAEHDVAAPGANDAARRPCAPPPTAIASRYQYANGFADIFETGVSALAAARARGHDVRRARRSMSTWPFCAPFPTAISPANTGCADGARVCARGARRLAGPKALPRETTLSPLALAIRPQTEGETPIIRAPART